MARGRPEHLQNLFDLPLGESLDLWPEADGNVSLLLKRLKQVSYLYLRQGKAYRLLARADRVTATRVPVGSQKKLSYIRDLKTGERYFVGESLTWKEKKALLARLDRVNLSNHCEGYWQAEVEPEGVYVRRIMTYGEPLTWWELGNVPRRALTLAR